MWIIIDDDFFRSDSAIGADCKTADIRCSVLVKPDNIVRRIVGQTVGLTIPGWHS